MVERDQRRGKHIAKPLLLSRAPIAIRFASEMQVSLTASVHFRWRHEKGEEKRECCHTVSSKMRVHEAGVPHHP